MSTAAARIGQVYPLGDLPRRRIGPACLHGPSAGRGPIVLFVHGGYHGAWCYERWLPIFTRAGWSMAALDLRGHGGLPQDADFARATISDYADDVLAAARALAAPVVLAGHSMGGAVVALAASRHRLEGLVLLAPSPPGNVPGLMQLPTYPEGRPYGPVDETICRRRFFPHHGDADISYLTRRLCADSPVALNERRRLATIVDPTRINGPVLCIAAGGDDPTLHADGIDERTAAFFRAEFHMLPDASHCFMLDGDVAQPAMIILDWLRRHWPRTAEPER